MSVVKRIWNKLFGRATTAATHDEQRIDDAATRRQQEERRRLQDELSLRTSRNGSFYSG